MRQTPAMTVLLSTSGGMTALNLMRGQGGGGTEDIGMRDRVNLRGKEEEKQDGSWREE